MSSTSSHESDVPLDPQSRNSGSHRVDAGEDSEAAAAVAAADDVVVIEPDEPDDSSDLNAAEERGATPVSVWSPGVPSASAPADAAAEEHGDSEELAVSEEPAVADSAEAVSEEPSVADAPGNGAERWSEIKAIFVDDPGESVKLASAMVERAMENLMTALRERQDSLASWQANDTAADTEELRKALRSYQSLFDELDGVSGHFRAGQDRVTNG